jgi:hypothetical protein
VLLVTEETVVVDHLETVSALTILTHIWFYYSASLNKFIMDVMALIALEASFFHFRDDIRVSDDNALHGYELIDMCRIQIPDFVLDSHTIRSHLDYWLICSILLWNLRSHHISTCIILIETKVILFVQSCHYKIEYWNNISGIVLKLLVEWDVKFIDMLAIHIQDVILSLMDLLQ